MEEFKIFINIILSLVGFVNCSSLFSIMTARWFVLLDLMGNILVFFLEHAKYGSLGKFKMNISFKYCIFSAMIFQNTHGIIRRDLNPQNILVCDDKVTEIVICKISLIIKIG